MNSVSRTSRNTSVSVIAVFPTTTATRSITKGFALCPAAMPCAAQIRAATVNERYTAAEVPMSKRLPDGNEEMKVPHVLYRRSRSSKKQLLVRPLQAEERRRIQGIREIHPDRSHNRA